MITRVLVASDDPAGVSAPADEVLNALNEGQELAAWLSLCLETKASLPLPASTTFGLLRGTFPDFLCPLRMSIGSRRIRPATLAELDGENDGWQNTPGDPARYVSLGFNFFGVTPQPVNTIAADFLYARSPAPMVGDDFPEIPAAYHESLVFYAKYRIRLKEGAQSLTRGMEFFHRFLDDMQKLGDFVRAKSRAARYDTLPFELALFDRARLAAAVSSKG